MPVSGSTSRSSLNFQSGAATRLAAVFGSLFVALILYAFEDVVARIPLATLSALLFITAVTLVKKRQILLCLKSTKSDACVFWITFFSCIFFSIDVAFYIGMGLSISLYLSKASIPQVVQYIVEKSGKIKNLEFCTKEEMTKIRFIKVKGNSFSALQTFFRQPSNQLQKMTPTQE